MPKRKSHKKYNLRVIRKVNHCVSGTERMGVDDTNWVRISCFDDPDSLVDVDVRVLNSIDGCRLASLIQNSEPSKDVHGREFFRAGNSLTRATLITLVRSIAVGRLVLAKGVTIGEALMAFDYEGISINGSVPDCIAVPSGGVAFSNRDSFASDALYTLCEKVADAIVSWPRLETTMASVMAKCNASRQWRTELDDFTQTQITSTATRAWVCFASQPKPVESDGDKWLALATKNPRWLSEGLIALGVLHNRLSEANPSFGPRRDESSFKELYRAVDADPLGTFFEVRSDACRASSDAKLKKELIRGERFYLEMRKAITDHIPDLLPYARAAIMLVDYNRRIAPVCAKLFSGACADESGVMLERSMLKKALKTRGVAVVRWSDTRDSQIRPLFFPPSWKDNSSSSCPSVLLNFEKII